MWGHMEAYVEWTNSAVGKEEIAARFHKVLKAYMPTSTVTMARDIKELCQRLHLDFRRRAITGATPGPEVPEATRRE